MTATSVRFTSIPMWVQVWGLPFDLLPEEVRRDIGNGLVLKVGRSTLKWLSRGRLSIPSIRENVNSNIVTMGVVLRQDHREVVSGVFIAGQSKGGAVVEPLAKAGTIVTVGLSKGSDVVEPVAKAGIVATIYGKLTPDFEAIIFELD
nr:hypothetical protein CFP56_35182 [Quercus suber]